MKIRENKQQWSGFIKKSNHTLVQKIQNRLNGPRIDNGEPLLKMEEVIDMAVEDFGKKIFSEIGAK